MSERIQKNDQEEESIWQKEIRENGDGAGCGRRACAVRVNAGERARQGSDGRFRQEGERPAYPSRRKQLKEITERLEGREGIYDKRCAVSESTGSDVKVSSLQCQQRAADRDADAGSNKGIPIPPGRQSSTGSDEGTEGIVDHCTGTGEGTKGTGSD